MSILHTAVYWRRKTIGIHHSIEVHQDPHLMIMVLTNKEFENCTIFWNQWHTAITPSALEVRPSWINQSFLGLFAKEFIRKGQIVCYYRGRQLNTVEAFRIDDKSYLMRICSQIYIDAKDSPECLAR